MLGIKIPANATRLILQYSQQQATLSKHCTCCCQLKDITAPAYINMLADSSFILPSFVHAASAHLYNKGRKACKQSLIQQTGLKRKTS